MGHCAENQESLLISVNLWPSPEKRCGAKKSFRVKLCGFFKLENWMRTRIRSNKGVLEGTFYAHSMNYSSIMDEWVMLFLPFVNLRFLFAWNKKRIFLLTPRFYSSSQSPISQSRFWVYQRIRIKMRHHWKGHFVSETWKRPPCIIPSLCFSL